MKGKLHKILLILLPLIFIAFFLLSCQEPPVEEKCPVPDASKITVSRGTVATGGMIISGDADSVLPGATVTITDSEGNSVTATADQEGGFSVVEADLPEDFDHTLGNELSVTQTAEGCTESDAVDVEIGL